VVLVSKVLPENASRKGTITACEASLRRLRTDRLDGYLLHWEGPHPLEDTFAAFEELVSAGKIRWWGVSNFDAAPLARSVAIAGPGRVACDQVLYHLKERAIEHRVIPTCREHGVAIVAYSPFGSGDFPEPSSAGGRVLAAVAERHGATPRQVALAFLTRDPDLFTIPKASRVRHVEENVAAGDLVLTPEDVAEIDRALPRGPVKPLPMI
jgi:diketogulonate reductase-like aldo/keto reductase